MKKAPDFHFLKFSNRIAPLFVLTALLSQTSFAGCPEMMLAHFSPEETASDQVSQRFLTEARSESTRLEKALLRSTKSGKLEVYDTVLIGVAGVNGDIVANTIQSNAPAAKILGIDAGDGTSFTFDSDFFQLNSSEDATKSSTPLPFLPTQLRDLIPDIKERVYPRARTLANGVHFGMASLDGDILLQNKVVSILKREDGTFEIITSKGIKVLAKKVVSGPGYGRPLDTFMDVESQNFIKTSTDAMKQNGDLSGLAVHFDDLKHYVESERVAGVVVDHQIDPLDVGVVGSSDGGSVVMQWLTREKDTGKRVWVGLSVKDGQGYIEQLENKPRYGPDIAPKIDSGKITPMPGRLKSLRQVVVDGKKKVLVTYTDQNVEKTTLLDVVVMATGYNRSSTDLLNGMTPTYFATNQDPEDLDTWNFIREREEKFKTEHPEDYQNATPNLYSVGVDGKDAIHLLSVFRGGRLSMEVGKQVASTVQVTRQIQEAAVMKDAVTSLVVKTPAVSLADTTQTKIAFSAARARMTKVFRSFSFKGKLSLSVSMASNQVNLQINGIEQTAANSILKKMNADQSLMADLKVFLQDHPAGMNLEIPNTTGGGLRMDQLILSLL